MRKRKSHTVYDSRSRQDVARIAEHDHGGSSPNKSDYPSGPSRDQTVVGYLDSGHIRSNHQLHGDGNGRLEPSSKKQPHKK